MTSEDEYFAVFLRSCGRRVPRRDPPQPDPKEVSPAALHATGLRPRTTEVLDMKNRTVHRTKTQATRSDGWIRLLSKRNIVHVGDCWIVEGKRDTYATLNDDGKQRHAHRLVYELIHGPLNDRDMVVHHNCLNPGCVNPKHLEAMTNAEHARLHRLLESAARRS